MNLLDQFVLQHVQTSSLKAKLIEVSKEPGSQEAKVELNLTPRMLNTDSGDELPAYQVSARLTCKGGSKGEPGPKFVASVGFEAIYQQIEGCFRIYVQPCQPDPAAISLVAAGIEDVAGQTGPGADSLAV
jgi:hypothetical protein